MYDMYDNFGEFRELNKIKFTFQPSRFEVWQNGNLKDSGLTDKKILFEPIVAEDAIITRVYNQNIKTRPYITETFDFDIFFTHSERLLMLTLPKNINRNDCIGLNSFRVNIQPTREFKIFGHDEPYCCSLFFKNNTLVIVTFSLNNPETLIEYYLN